MSFETSPVELWFLILLKVLCAVTFIQTIVFIFTLWKASVDKYGKFWFMHLQSGTKSAMFAICSWIFAIIGSMAHILFSTDWIVIYSNDNYRNDCPGPHHIGCSRCILYQIVTLQTYTIKQMCHFVIMFNVLQDSIIATMMCDDKNKKNNGTLCKTKFISANNNPNLDSNHNNINSIKLDKKTAMWLFIGKIVIFGPLIVTVSSQFFQDEEDWQVLELEKNENVRICSRAQVEDDVDIDGIGVVLYIAWLVIAPLLILAMFLKTLTQLYEKSYEMAQRTTSHSHQFQPVAIPECEEDNESTGRSSVSSQQSDKHIDRHKGVELKVRVSFGKINLMTNDLHLARDKQLQSIIDVMSRHTIIVTTYVLATVISFAIPSLLYQGWYLEYGQPFTFINHSILIYMMFPPGKTIFNYVCSKPHLACILCILRHGAKKSIKHKNNKNSTPTMFQSVGNNLNLDTENSHTQPASIGQLNETSMAIAKSVCYSESDPV